MIKVTPAQPLPNSDLPIPDQNRVGVVFQRNLPLINYESITAEILKASKALVYIYKDEKNKPPQFTPDERKADGTAPGAMYRTGHQAQLWQGKRGRDPSGKLDPSRRESILKSMNSEVIQEKLASDLYKELGQDLFDVPKTLLSKQKIADGFHDEIKANELDTNWGIKETLRIMSQMIDGYKDFKKAWTQDLEGKPIPFMDFIRRYHRPPEKVVTEGTLVPLRGFMEMLAVGRALADIDILGIEGANAGFTWVQDQEGTIVAAKTVKIDPGEAFRFGDAPPADDRNIKTAQHEGFRVAIEWEELLDSQKDAFLSTLMNCFRYKHHQDLLNFLFFRDNAFSFYPKEEIPFEISKKLPPDMAEHLIKQEEIYSNEILFFYQRNPQEKMRGQYIHLHGQLRLPFSNKSFPIRDLFTQLVLVESEEVKVKEKQLSEKEKEKQVPEKGFKIQPELLEKDSLREALDRLHSVSEPVTLENLFSPLQNKKPIHKIFLVGRAGIGKSTLCQKIAYDWASGRLWQEYEAIYWLPLRECNQPSNPGGSLAGINDPEDWLANALGHVVLKDYRFVKALKKQLHHIKQKILILCDGYDEVSSRGLFQALETLLLKSDFNIIVTSRPGAMSSLHAHMDRVVEIMGFSDEQISTHASSFFRIHEHTLANAQTQTKAFLSTVKGNPHFFGMAHVPLHLQLLCGLWQRGVAFPSTLTELYRITLDELFQYQSLRESQDVQKVSPEEKETLFSCLGEVALHGLDSQKLLIPEEEIDRICMACTKNRPAFPIKKEQLLSSGLLKITSEREYYFVHLTFQEYLAARMVSQSSTEKQKLFVIERRYEPSFRLVLVFLAGILHRELEITQRDNPNFLLVPGFLSGLVYPEVVQRTEHLQNFFSWLHSSEGVDMVGIVQLELFVQCLNECPSADLWKKTDNKYQIKKTFTDIVERGWGRRYTVPVLGKVGKIAFAELIPGILATLIRNLAIRGNTRINEYTTARALGDVVQVVPAELIPEISATLTRETLNNKDDSTCLDTASALGKLAKVASEGLVSNIVATLTQALNRQNSYKHDRATVFALGEVAKAASVELPKIFEGFKLVLKKGPDYLKKDVIKALGKAGKAKSAEKYKQEIINTLIEALNNHDRDIQNEAVKALSEVAKAAPAERHNIQAALIRVAFNDYDTIVRCTAIRALLDIKKVASVEIYIPDILPALIPTLKELDYLKKINDIHDIHCIRAALETLGEFTKVTERQIPDDFLFLIHALNVKEVSWTASKVLSEIGIQSPPNLIPKIFNALTRVLEDINTPFQKNNQNEFDVRRSHKKYALAALGEVGKAEDAEAYISDILPDLTRAALYDQNAYVRCGNTEALGEVGKAESAETHMQGIVETLITALEDPHNAVRIAAATALGKVGKGEFAETYIPKILAALSRALNDLDVSIRCAAATALGEVASAETHFREVLAALSRALNDQDKYVRNAAAKAFGEIGKIESAETYIPEILTALSRALNDPAAYVCETAAEALGEIGTITSIEHFALIVSTLAEALRHSKINPRHIENALKDIPFSKYVKILETPHWMVLAPFLIQQAIEKNSPVYVKKFQEGMHLCLIENNRIISHPITLEQIQFFKKWCTANGPLHTYVSSYIN